VSPRRRPRHPARAISPAARDLGGAIAAAALAAVLAGSALVVDTAAAAAFDAPKRLVSLVGIAVAAAALLVAPWRAGEWSWRRASLEQRIALALLIVALLGAVTACALSPRRDVSIDTTRGVLLFALLLPLGASRALHGARSRVLGVAFVGACLVNAIVASLQYWAGLPLFRLETLGGRVDASAFAGNDGYLALTLALGGVICLGSGLAARRAGSRVAAAGAGLVLLSGIAVNQNLTAVLALAAGAVVLLALWGHRRVVIGATVVVLVAGAALIAHPALSRRAQDTLQTARAGEWDRLLTYRLGPWAAALEMARERPLVGWGPGTFGAEFVPHRLRAELRWHRRFVNPFLAGSYTEAHSDYLQAVAEAGLAAGLAAVGAAAALMVGLLRVARHAQDVSARHEAVVLLALLAAGAAAALAWFPLQRPMTAVPLLLAAGRAWRIVGGSAAGDAR
jgi:O-antigen ligase